MWLTVTVGLLSPARRAPFEIKNSLKRIDLENE
jgi:hypothetical protein